MRARLQMAIARIARRRGRSEEHTSELQSRLHLVCRLLLEKKNDNILRALHAAHLPTHHASPLPRFTASRLSSRARLIHTSRLQRAPPGPYRRDYQISPPTR